MDTAACEIEAAEAGVDFESVFRVHFARVARVIARVVRDHARAEELAVEVFLKLWSNPELHAEMSEGWLYRTAVRKGLDELRSRNRRARYERLFGWGRRVENPEEIRSATEEQERVRRVLAAMGRRDAELLVLRSNGFSYEELAGALGSNPSSIGTLVSRAQAAFRKRYIKLYGAIAK